MAEVGVELTVRFVDQTIFGGGEDGGEAGNCLAACLASLLGLSLSDVPNFVADPDNFPENKDAWLAKRGYGYAWWGVEPPAMLDELPELMKKGGIVSVGLHLLYGTSKRGLLHSVVGRGGVMVHDPHPSKSGLVDVSGIGLIFPLDPIQDQVFVGRYEKTIPGVSHEPIVDVRNSIECDHERATYSETGEFASCRERK